MVYLFHILSQTIQACCAPRSDGKVIGVLQVLRDEKTCADEQDNVGADMESEFKSALRGGEIVHDTPYLFHITIFLLEDESTILR